MYGPYRTYVKAMGRSRRGLSLPSISLTKRKRVAIIGCGQFAFSTVGYYLSLQKDVEIVTCFDKDIKRSKSFARFYRVQKICSSFEDLCQVELIDCYYVVSNHASHATYAHHLLITGKKVFVEKPLVVSLKQWHQLYEIKIKKDRLYLGYNRPFSPHIIEALKNIKRNLPISLCCQISGHFIEEDHWYRNTGEGTRISGNMGHWIDLFVHTLFRAERDVDSFEVTIVSADSSSKDDNISVTIVTSGGDICTIHLGSRSEPFEGIKENLMLLQESVQIFFLDFQKTIIYSEETKKQFKTIYKNVGHKSSILQPFKDERRNSIEWWISSFITASIAENILVNETNFNLKIPVE